MLWNYFGHKNHIKVTKYNRHIVNVLYIVNYILSLYPRSPYSVPKLLFWRQPWLPRGQGWTTTQLCSYWTVYWLANPTNSAEHNPPDNHPLLQWPLREQAGVQTELSRWVLMGFKTNWDCFWSFYYRDFCRHKGHKPWGVTAGTSSQKLPPEGMLRDGLLGCLNDLKKINCLFKSSE